MKNTKKKLSLKEGVFISFSFWPTLLIGAALGMTISLLLILNISNSELLLIVNTYSIIWVMIAGVATRLISIYLWKKYDWQFTSNMK